MSYTTYRDEGNIKYLQRKTKKGKSGKEKMPYRASCKKYEKQD